MEKCWFCDGDLDANRGTGPSDRIAPVNVCRRCAVEIIPHSPRTAQHILECIGAPVLLIDADVRVRAANSRARALLGKKSEEDVDGLGGDVLECAYALLPGGCGKTEHCKACTIRNTVAGTFADGKSTDNVLAYQYVRTPRGLRRKRMNISTQKVGEVVLLQIDDVAEDDWSLTGDCS